MGMPVRLSVQLLERRLEVKVDAQYKGNEVGKQSVGKLHFRLVQASLQTKNTGARVNTRSSKAFAHFWTQHPTVTCSTQDILYGATFNTDVILHPRNPIGAGGQRCAGGGLHRWQSRGP